MRLVIWFEGACQGTGLGVGLVCSERCEVGLCEVLAVGRRVWIPKSLLRGLEAI